MNIPSKVQQEIDRRQKEIEELRNNAFKTQLIETAHRKNVTTEELYTDAKAYTNEIERQKRVANLATAREAKADKKETATPA